MENRRGSGIFLGVVGVATLVVAIIGATFAYFSASVTAQNSVDVTAYEFDADVVLTQVSPIADNSAAKLIPLDPDATVTGSTETNLLYALNTAGCISEINGVKYQACALYKLEVINDGANEITLDGELRTIKNESTIEGNKFQYLTYQNLSGETEGSLTLGTTVEILPLEVYSTEADADNTNAVMDLETLTVASETTETRYFVVYLDEQEELNNSEMGSSYTGQITYTDSASGSRLTATFTATNPSA